MVQRPALPVSTATRSWHGAERLIVLSVWHEDRCTACFRMPVQDAGNLIATIADAMSRALSLPSRHTEQSPTATVASGAEAPSDAARHRLSGLRRLPSMTWAASRARSRTRALNGGGGGAHAAAASSRSRTEPFGPITSSRSQPRAFHQSRMAASVWAAASGLRSRVGL